MALQVANDGSLSEAPLIPFALPSLGNIALYPVFIYSVEGNTGPVDFGSGRKTY